MVFRVLERNIQVLVDFGNLLEIERHLEALHIYQ